MHVLKDYDEFFMQTAISLAKKGWGKTGVNPLVGAVVTKHNKIIGQGFHRKMGEAHAEVCALTDAGSRARNATLYVNLEPCCCVGYTPPCVEAIINANIMRVVIGMIDPNPAVNGMGVDKLKENKIKVTLHVLEKEAKELNVWYEKYITQRIPYILVKVAVSKDGKISGFKEKYITSEKSRRFVHSLRSQVSAVLVGITTVLTDNPYLTDRLVGRNNPARVVIDPHLRIPLESNFLRPDGRKIIITSRENDPGKIEQLIARGAEIILLKGEYYSLQDIVQKLGSLNIASLLVEGGGKTFSQFYSEKLYDELFLFVAPTESGQGLALGDTILRDVCSKVVTPVKIQEDLLYHVYRNN
jgi:diaminohydroxyphosphoribosylaminopyrimidine deaminase/5-amino-6-(5-phosphoribosylamino)uracil reductase